MLSQFLLIAFRNAVMFLISQTMRSVMSSILKRVLAAVQSVLAQYPLLASWVLSAAVAALARFGLNVSEDQLVVIVSAALALVNSLIRHAQVSVAAKPARK